MLQTALLLDEINKNALYTAAGHRMMEDYAAKRWHIKFAHVYRLLAVAAVAKALETSHSTNHAVRDAINEVRFLRAWLAMREYALFDPRSPESLDVRPVVQLIEYAKANSVLAKLNGPKVHQFGQALGLKRLRGREDKPLAGIFKIAVQQVKKIVKHCRNSDLKGLVSAIEVLSNLVMDELRSASALISCDPVASPSARATPSTVVCAPPLRQHVDPEKRNVAKSASGNANAPQPGPDLFGKTVPVAPNGEAMSAYHQAAHRRRQKRPGTASDGQATLFPF